MATPKILKNFNLYIGGVTLLGKVEEVTLPDLNVITEEHRAGGMDSPMDIDMGIEKLTLGWKSAEHSAETYSLFGLRNQNAVDVQFRGALVDDRTVTPYIVTARGMMTSIKGGTASPAAKNPMEATVSLRYYKLEIGGRTVLEIDVDNLVRQTGDGVDQMAEIRDILNG